MKLVARLVATSAANYIHNRAQSANFRSPYSHFCSTAMPTRSDCQENGTEYSGPQQALHKNAWHRARSCLLAFSGCVDMSGA